MKLQSAALLGSLTFALVSIGCSSSSTLSGSGGSNGTGSGGTTSGSGGATSTGGSGNGTGGGSASCTNVTACGGTASGTYTVKSSCLTISGDLDVQTLFFLSCPTGHVTGTLQVTGTFTANANGTFTDATTTTGTEMLSLPAACKVLSGAPVTCDRIGSVMAGSYYSDATCVDAASGGGCDCTGTVNQTGSLGHVVGDPQTDGNFTTGSNTLTITQDSMKYGYCASGTMLTLTPQGSSPTTTGSIVLQSGSTSGSGGSTGGGGKGGSTGAGGTGGTGGKAGNGGGGRGTGGSAGGTGTGGTTGPKGMGPCDIYGAANMPCAAAFSMVRALSSKYAGPLYQVRNHSSSMNQGSGGSTMEVPQTSDGYADTSVQDTFCMGTTCTVSILYDQSGNGNDLKSAPSGPAGNGSSGTADYESSATKLSVTAGGHKVYALYMNAVEGYRTGLNVKGKNMPGMNMDEGIYELADGTHYGTACCWDFGNVTTNPAQYHTMNTIFFGTGYWGKGAPGGAKPGPWFEADFEGGVWAGGSSAGDPGGSNGTVANTMDPALPVDFAFATLKTSKPSSTMYSLRVANAATATDLTTAYNGKAPTTNWDNPGGILLGVGGDNSNNSAGTFYEGAIVSGLPTDATDLAVLKNVQAVGYKK